MAVHLLIDIQNDFFSIGWNDLPMNMANQLTDEIAIALMLQFLKLFMRFEDINLHEVHFHNPAPKNVAQYEQYFRCKVRFSQESRRLLFPFKNCLAPFPKAIRPYKNC